MLKRSLPTAAALLISLGIFGQGTVLQQGKTFARPVKGAQGNLYTVVDGLMDAPGGPLLYVEDGLAHKVVRLNKDLEPVEEVILKDVLQDGLKWNGAGPLVVNGVLHCVLMAQGKKSVEFAIANIPTSGAPALNGFRKLVSFDQAPMNDPATTLVRRPLPDPILFSRGLAFAQQERIISSPDGQLFLINLPSNGPKGQKRFWYAVLDQQLNVLRQDMKELPYEDAKSTVQQIALTNDGIVHLVTYVFACKTEEQRSDKLCHELHLTTIKEGKDPPKDLLIDKDFVSSARLRLREKGLLTFAIRYGALTGKPGMVMTFDPADPKLKPTPVVAQRLPSIRKAKLNTFGVPGQVDKGGASSRATAKVPNEVVDLVPAWDGGSVLIEMYLEQAFELPMGDAIAIRRLCGGIRATYLDEKDSTRWQRTLDRVFLTTAGQPFETVAISLSKRGLVLAYDHTPRGMDGVMRLGNVDPAEEARSRKERAGPLEPGVLKITVIGPDGQILQEGTALAPDSGQLPSPMSMMVDGTGQKALIKSFDGGSSYSYTLIDLEKVGR